MRPSQPQKSQENKTWEDLIKEAYLGKSNSIEASHEVTYYHFKRHLGMEPEEVNKMPLKRMRAWVCLMKEDNLITDKRHTQMCELIAHIGGLKLKK
jgi:hypothetical protein